MADGISSRRQTTRQRLTVHRHRNSAKSRRQPSADRRAARYADGQRLTVGQPNSLPGGDGRLLFMNKGMSPVIDRSSRPPAGTSRPADALARARFLI
ncbi:MAG: hypothetical protein LBI96_06790 [Odoribacteraceae bacterium]|nr:hypothetical protein [Odoribacteraceae bacterium]